MRKFLLLDMYQEPNNPMEIGWAHVTVQDDHRLIIDDTGSSRSLSQAQVIELITDQTLIVKNTGTIYKHLRKYMPDITRNNKPCNRIIGITSTYTTEENRPANSKLASFSTIRNGFGISFSHIAQFVKKHKLEPPKNGVSDSVIFLALILEVDMIDHLQLWQESIQKQGG